jgi:hypothetical protein
MFPRSGFLAVLGACAVTGLVACGGDESPTAAPTPAPTVAPTPTPTAAPTPVACFPTPPPLHGIKVRLVNSGGYKKTIGAEPLVANYDGYCGKVGFDPNQLFCTTRTADDPMKRACDAAAVGVAVDTKRPGPTWNYEGQACTSVGDQPGCENHESDQFLAYAKGRGIFEACAPAALVDPDGSRCGGIEFK